MRIYGVLFPLVIASCWAAAADLKPLDVKMGLWETTSTFQTSGMPPVSIPPDALANMSPEQRARVEAMMKGSGNARTTTVKSCMTPEKMKKHEMFTNDKSDCTRTVVSSSSNKWRCGCNVTVTGVRPTALFELRQ